MRVTFAYPRTAADGTKYEPDQSADLDESEARQLIKDGFARPADTTRAQTKTAAPARSTAKGDDS
ncbi:hypothetical protein AB4225_06065 [Streptomyces sp. 2RAF24]|uniref:hypothetical protein n=1 Tax=Streptomyces sp. 2RAF24 TaxID=3232997 RepID=UPI003F9781CD